MAMNDAKGMRVAVGEGGDSTVLTMFGHLAAGNYVVRIKTSRGVAHDMMVTDFRSEDGVLYIIGRGYNPVIEDYRSNSGPEMRFAFFDDIDELMVY